MYIVFLLTLCLLKYRNVENACGHNNTSVDVCNIVKHQICDPTLALTYKNMYAKIGI